MEATKTETTDRGLMPKGAPLTVAERQARLRARRLEQFCKMRDALEAIRLVASLKEAKALANAALNTI